jgi:catechol 2,3-dioxygenase-like lactoylglutathione lyase family enzyme
MAGFGFNHVAFNCRDVPRQERFYAKHFGFKRSRTFNRGTPGGSSCSSSARRGWNSFPPIR